MSYTFCEQIGDYAILHTSSLIIPTEREATIRLSDDNGDSFTLKIAFGESPDGKPEVKQTIDDGVLLLRFMNGTGSGTFTTIEPTLIAQMDDGAEIYLSLVGRKFAHKNGGHLITYSILKKG